MKMLTRVLKFGVQKNAMTTSNTSAAQSSSPGVLPGYSAIPPLPLSNGSIGAQGSNGQFLTATGMNGSSWMSQGITTTAQPNAIQIGNPDPVITFRMDGDIITRAGTISADDWISVIKVMKQLIIDMSKDQELASKYPYIQDAAHTWFMNELKGKDNGNKET